MSAPYMKLWIGDYLADTSHLTRAQHGSYLLLLMAMYRAGGRLPGDNARLARIAKCSPEEWAADRRILLGFFRREGLLLTHKRVALEIEKTEQIREARRGAGKAGGEAKANKSNDVIEGFASDLPPNARADHSHSHSRLPKKSLPSGQRPSSGGARGARLPAGWVLDEAGLSYALKQGFSADDAGRIAEGFRDYWLAKDGADAKKRDWAATWRTWVRREAAQDRRPKQATFV